MTDRSRSIVKEFIDRLCKSERVAYLIARWQEEREHEDINEYRPHLQREAPDGVEITGMTKRPFGCRFSIDAERFVLKLFANGRVRVEVSR